MQVQVSKWSTFVPLAVPDYRRLLTGTVLWWQCFHMEMVVLGWLVFDLTSSPWMVSLVSFARTLPLLLMGLFSSSIIDYFGRRPVVIVAQFVNLCAYVAMIFKNDGNDVDEDMTGFIKTCFEHKRKHLRQALVRRYGEEKTTSLYASMGFLPSIRAEEIAPEKFRVMYAFMSSTDEGGL